jgi:hypothetical protein
MIWGGKQMFSTWRAEGQEVYIIPKEENYKGYTIRIRVRDFSGKTVSVRPKYDHDRYLAKVDGREEDFRIDQPLREDQGIEFFLERKKESCVNVKIISITDKVDNKKVRLGIYTDANFLIRNKEKYDVKTETQLRQELGLHKVRMATKAE